MSSLHAIVICQKYIRITVISSQFLLFAPSLVIRRCTLWDPQLKVLTSGDESGKWCLSIWTDLIRSQKAPRRPIYTTEARRNNYTSKLTAYFVSVVNHFKLLKKRRFKQNILNFNLFNAFWISCNSMSAKDLKLSGVLTVFNSFAKRCRMAWEPNCQQSYNTLHRGI